MTNHSFRRTLVGVAVAAALGVLATPAGAAPYRGTFDPTDFEGEYIINVSPECLQQADGWYANAGICSATLLSTFADVVSTDVTPPFTGRLIFAPPQITSPSTLFGIYVYGGAIDSFDTDLIHHQAGSDPTSDDWWIQFVSGQMAPPCVDCYGPALVGPTIAPWELDKGVYLYLNDPLGSPIATAEYLGPAVDIGAVPEPGTLSLVLGALVAFCSGWLARRRRRQKVFGPN